MGAANFQKLFQKFSQFSLDRSMIFRALAKHLENFGKRPKKAFLGTFWFLGALKKHVFSVRALLSKLAYFGAKGALENFYGPEKGYLEIVQRGNPLGRQRVESLKRGERPPHPKSAPESQVKQLT